MSRKFKVSIQSDKNNGTSHEDRYTYLIISRSVLLIMRTDWVKSCTENQNTHFMSNNFFSKILSFMR